MNNERRNTIKALRHQIEAIHAAIADIDFDNIASEIGDIRDEEQEYFDNMPESFQNGDKGDRAQEAITQLEAAAEYMNELTEVLQTLENAVGCLETAAE